MGTRLRGSGSAPDAPGVFWDQGSGFMACLEVQGTYDPNYSGIYSPLSPLSPPSRVRSRLMIGVRSTHEPPSRVALWGLKLSAFALQKTCNSIRLPKSWVWGLGSGLSVT